MVGRTKPATKAEKARIVKIKEHGCYACNFERVWQRSPTEAHHLLSGGKRRGHSFCVPLCGWHHRGIPVWDTTATRNVYGPSLRLESKAFHERYGSDDAILDTVNRLIA